MMTEQLKRLADQCWSHRIDGTLIDGHLHFDTAKFARLIAEQCAAICMSQADRKNIRQAFGIPVESSVKYPGEAEHNSITSQYNRPFNLPPSGEQL